MIENNLWEPEVHNTIAAFYCEYPQVPRQIAQMQFEDLKFWPFQNFTIPNTFIISCLEVAV